MSKRRFTFTIDDPCGSLNRLAQDTRIPHAAIAYWGEMLRASGMQAPSVDELARFIESMDGDAQDNLMPRDEYPDGWEFQIEESKWSAVVRGCVNGGRK